MCGGVFAFGMLGVFVMDLYSHCFFTAACELPKNVIYKLVAIEVQSINMEIVPKLYRMMYKALHRGFSSMSCLGSNLFNFSSCPYSPSEKNRRVSNGREEIIIRTQLPLLSRKSVTGSPSINK